MHTQKRVISLISLVLTLLLYSCNMPQKEVKRIILIHSFEEDRENYSFFNEELMKELDKQHIEADIHPFYLDCERVDIKQEPLKMYAYIDSIRQINPDIILVNDDQATYTLLTCGHPFVKELPIVFAGVNFPNWELIKKYPNVTGWHDRQDFVKNIEFIHTLFGQLTVRIAYDRTVLGKFSFAEVLKQIRPNKDITIVRAEKAYFNNRINYKTDSVSYQILMDSTKNNPNIQTPIQPNALAKVQFLALRLLSGIDMLTSLSRMETSTVYLDVKYDYTSEGMPLLVTYPSFSAHNEPVQYSPTTNSRYIGGYLTSLETQAREQAQTAATILKGTPISQIPIRESAKEYLLMWAPIKTWGLSLDQIPSYVRVVGVPFQEKHKTVLSWITIISFITIIIIASLLGRMYIREQRFKKQAQKDLIRKNKELEIALEKAKESDHMKSAFLANMSHEIRTPLNAIVGFSNLLNTDMELEIEERTEFLDLINTNSELLLNLINDILDLSRIESGRMTFNFDHYNLHELIHDIYSTYKMLMPSGVQLEIEMPESSVMIYTDKNRLMQVVTNFLNNAIKFTQKGYIKLGYTFDAESQFVHLFVEDTGKGIAKEKQAAVFERFTKLDEFAQGTGLGLSICKVITERFSGRITVSSEEGKGSRFTVILPLKPNDQEA